MAKKYPFLSYLPPEMTLRKKEPRYTTKDEWKRVLQEMLTRYTKHYNKKEGRELLDLSGPVMKRRTDVILSRIDEVYRRYSDLLECI